MTYTNHFFFAKKRTDSRNNWIEPVEPGNHEVRVRSPVGEDNDYGNMLESEYLHWFNAIANNDAEHVEKSLSNAVEAEKLKLLNGRFMFNDTDTSGPREADIGMSFRVSRPLHVAIAFTSYDVIATFLKYNVDYEVTDYHGNNIIHTLAHLIHIKPETEEDIRDLYQKILQIVPTSDMKTMLFQENEDKLRPLEVACHLGVLGLFQDIFQTKGVYVVNEKRTGIFTEQFIDVTDYETMGPGNRREKSPLVFLSLLDKSCLSYKDKPLSPSKLFCVEYIVSWIQSKLKSNYVLIIIWFIWRLFHSLCLMIVDAFLLVGEEELVIKKICNDSNGTNGSTSVNCEIPASETCMMRTVPLSMRDFAFNMVLVIYLTLHSSVALAFEFREICNGFFSRAWIYHLPDRKKQLILHYWFYRVTQTILHIFVILNVFIRITRHLGLIDVPILMDNFLYLGLAICMGWSVLFFLQLVPKVSHFAIVLQRMVGDLGICTFVIVTFAFPYVVVLERIVNRGHIDCVEGFSSFWESWYSIFLALNNMLDFTQLVNVAPEAADAFAIYVIHVVFVFFVGILMINFLIALFSSSVTEVYEHKHVIINIQKLNIVVGLEARLSKLMACWYKKMHSRFFHIENGRILLVRTVIAEKTYQ